MAKISVIIPVYNVEKYLKRCLDSVINQTLRDIEIICINDCSTDNSLEILKEYAQNDTRIKLINLKEKQNAAIARNYGLDNAQSEYLGFVDSDDYIDLDFYEKLYNCALKTNADIIKGNLKEKCLDNKIIISPMNNDIMQSGEKMHFFSDWQTAIYKKSLIDKNSIKFPTECPKGQDIVFLCRCVVKTQTLNIIDDTYYNYIRRKNSLESNSLDNTRALSAIKSCDLICECLNNSWTEISKNGYVFAYFKRLYRYLYLFYTNKTSDIRMTAINSLIKYYNVAQYKEKIDESIETFNIDFIFELVKNNQADKIFKELSKYNSSQVFFQKNLLYKLRKNIKRSTPVA